MKNTENRRKFIINLSSALGAGLVFVPLTQLLNSCEHQEPTGTINKELIIPLNQYPVLNEVGKFQKITEGNLPILIIRKSQTEFLILSLICTHQGCEVDVPDTNNILNCYCHNSRFSADDGSVVKGPDDGSNISSLKKLQYTYDSNSNQLKIIF